MNAGEISSRRACAVDAVTALVEQLTSLLACCDVLDTRGHQTAAREARRALMRATTALHVLREELLTVEIVEHYLRAHTEEDPPVS